MTVKLGVYTLLALLLNTAACIIDASGCARLSAIQLLHDTGGIP